MANNSTGKLRRLKRVALFSVGGGLAAVAIALGAHTFFDFSESSAFCGKTCHQPMYPEYTTYQASPHSNVECSKCHVGSGTLNMVISKIRGIPQIVQTLKGNYPKPIRAPLSGLRPVMETCEQCHSPQKFSGELVKRVVTYKPDATNTQQSYSLVLKVGGGGTDVTGGIHWHIVSKVWYLPMDDQHFNVGWVGVERPDGGKDEYVNPQYMGSITPEMIQKDKRQMDCVDCHNRVTHVFSPPGDLIDKAILDGSIDQSLPYIKAKGMAALDPQNASLEAAYAKVDAIESYYKTSYPSLYASSKSKIDKAIAKLKDIAKLSTFPDNGVNWNTYPDFSGHNKPTDKLLAGLDTTFDNWKKDPSQGCFRCHGTLVPATKNPAAVKMGLGATSTYAMLLASTPYPTDNLTGMTLGDNRTAGATGASGDNRTASRVPKLKDTVDIGCNLCHYSPADKPTSPLPKDVVHPTEKLSDCMVCHGKTGPEPIPNDHPWSTNEACVACHKVAPGTLPATKPSELSKKQIPHAVKGLEDCLLCHGPTSVTPIGKDHPWAPNDTCSACHVLSPTLKPLPPADRAVGFAVSISHALNGLEDCLLCHGSSSAKPVPADHPWATNDTCRVCHAASVTISQSPGSSPNPAPAVGHSTQGLSSCLMCHGSGGIRPSSASHNGIPETFCLLCHQPGSTNVPPPAPINAVGIPHSTTGLQDCLLCHGSSGIQPYPSDHVGRDNIMCTVCHKPASASQILAVSTGSASSVTATSAILSGNLDRLGSAPSANVSIQWGATSGSYSHETTWQPFPTTGAFQSAITGLTSGSTYYYRAKAVAGNTVTNGTERSFTTTGSSPGGGGGATPPTVTTGSAAGITASAATLNGVLVSLGNVSSANVSFEWGTTSGSYAYQTPTSTLTAADQYQADITGLSAATTYYFRAKAVGSSTVFGAETSFVTGQATIPPSVATDGAVDITGNSATLQGTFTGLGSAPTVNISFQWGTTSGSYSDETPTATMGTTAPFQATITGLTTGTKYYFRAKAAGAGTAYGAEMSFTAGQSGNSPLVTTSNAINFTPNSAELRGKLDSLGSFTSIDVCFQWATTSGSYIGETTPTTMGTTGIFQFNLTGLSPGTTYYFRAKAASATTTVYGSQNSFTTP